MIKINLLQERKAKRSDAKGQEAALVSFMLLGGAAAATYFFLHAPLVEKVDADRAAKARVEKSIKKLQEETKDFDVINQEFQKSQSQKDSIDRLNGTRAVPAWLLHELSNILTRDHNPIMSRDMEERIKSDHNRQWTAAWDPKRLWLESFEEKDGRFTLKGGAQADGDMTQLALRMQASAHFAEVVPEGGSTETDGRTKVSYYKFTISGRVVY